MAVLPRPRPAVINWRLTSVFLLSTGISATWGCGEYADPPQPPISNVGEGSGLMLPPGFKPVDLPLENRKLIFQEAHRIRALAVLEANEKLPMDEASLPKGDTPAFDKRVADHKAIIDGILEKNLANLAEQKSLTLEDLSKIEEEARRLRWVPPQEPRWEREKAAGK